MERLLFMSALIVAALAVAVPAQASVMYNSGLTQIAHGNAVDGVQDTNYASLASGDLITFTPTGPATYGGYGFNLVNDGNFGTNNCCIPTPDTGTVTLTFADTVTVGEIEIHMGYINRDDGTYTIKDDQGITRGVFTIVTQGLGNRSNQYGGVDYFLASFSQPFETGSLRIDYVVDHASNGDNTTSFCEIQVFEGVPEPATLGLLTAGGGLALLRRRR